MKARAGMSVVVMAVGLFAVAPAFGQSRAGDVVPDHYIVVLKAGASPSDVARDHGLTPTQVYRTAFNGFAAVISRSAWQRFRPTPAWTSLSPMW